MISPLYLLARETASYLNVSTYLTTMSSEYMMLTFDFPVPVEPTITIMGSFGGLLFDIEVIVRVTALQRRCIARGLVWRHFGLSMLCHDGGWDLMVVRGDCCQ